MEFALVSVFRDNSSFGLNILGPLCLWQCFLKMPALINVIESSWLSKPQQLPLFTTGSHNRLFPAGTTESSKYPSKVQRYVVIKRNFKKTCKKVSSKTSGMQISRIHASRAGSDGVFQLRIGSGSVIGKKSTQTFVCQLQTQPLERRREVVKEIQENSSTGQV